MKQNNFDHIYVKQSAKSIGFESIKGGGGESNTMPERDIPNHSKQLLEEIKLARAANIKALNDFNIEVKSADKGMLLEFKAQQDFKLNYGVLVSNTKNKNTDLLKVHVDENDNVISAIVYVPEEKSDFFDKKIEKYQYKNCFHVVSGDEEKAIKKAARRDGLVVLKGSEMGVVNKIFYTSKEDGKVYKLTEGQDFYQDHKIIFDKIINYDHKSDGKYLLQDIGIELDDINKLISSLGYVQYKDFSSIESISPIISIDKLWKDERKLTKDDKITHYEIWLRKDVLQNFKLKAKDFDDVTISNYSLYFPDGEICMVSCSLQSLTKLEFSTKALSGFRYLDTPASFFTNLEPREQEEWANELKGRIKKHVNIETTVCILDTGINSNHSLLKDFIREEDVDSYDPDWGGYDSHGHGTETAGLALYGDLKLHLESQEEVAISHGLESIKILPDQGQNKEGLYGFIMREAISRARVNNPRNSRVFCMSVTTEGYNGSGRPSSWSSTIDQISCGVSVIEGISLQKELLMNDDDKCLFTISAGNIRGTLHQLEYPARNELEKIEDPAQSWNALTVGAYTEKMLPQNSAFDGYSIVAENGDLSPTSRTSLLWDKNNYWPIKPDVVFEGGNRLYGKSGEMDSHDDLSLLTTSSKRNLFTYTLDTSAANAQVARLAALIKVKYPDYWPETVRALIIHSSSWHKTMMGTNSLKEFKGKKEDDKLAVLRKFGYGVPNLDKAINSVSNRACIVFQDSLTPFSEDRSLLEMNFYKLPWPSEELKSIALTTDVKIKVTLSYFIEPSPSDIPPKSQFAYASHGLRFSFKRAGEDDQVFLSRINGKERKNDPNYDKKRNGKTRNWVIGSKRNRGSVISDTWLGTGQELSEQDSIAIYPTGGWWKDRKSFKRCNQKIRYSLVVSLEVAENVDIYEVILQKTKIQNSVEIS